MRLSRLPIHLIRILFYLAVFLTPVLGVWLASSLVAYINGPTLLAASSGILLFPLLPILWDLRGRKKRKSGILTWGDRITLRTLLLNLIFIGLLLAMRPQTSFLALSTRGDWFLDGMSGPQVELARQGLFKLANGLEGLYLVFYDNPFDQYADITQVKPQPTTDTKPRQAGQAKGWPWTDVGLHPAVINMPASAETSIESVAQYIASQEKDPMLRIKALHDYVADRIAYDAPNYFAGELSPPGRRDRLSTPGCRLCRLRQTTGGPGPGLLEKKLSMSPATLAAPPATWKARAMPGMPPKSKGNGISSIPPGTAVM